MRTGNILYIVAGVLIAFWTVGFFRYNTGMTIHILLLMAAMSVIVKIILEKKTNEEN